MFLSYILQLDILFQNKGDIILFPFQGVRFCTTDFLGLENSIEIVIVLL